MKEVKITIPDNCELIKEGDSYIIKEKSRNVPRSWEEFCIQYPDKCGEAYITDGSEILLDRGVAERNDADRNLCASKKEAEAFLALMQLRQLRKAWVGDWKPSKKEYWAIIVKVGGEFKIGDYYQLSKVMSFPTKEMAEEFLNCFRDLCETAKILL